MIHNHVPNNIYIYFILVSAHDSGNAYTDTKSTSLDELLTIRILIKLKP